MDVSGVRDLVVSNSYLHTAVILTITIVLAYTILHILEGLLRVFHKGNKQFDHKLLSALETPIILIIILVGIQLSVENFLAESNSFSNVIMTAIIILVTYILIRLAAIILEFWSRRISQTKGQEFHSEVLPLTKSVFGIVLSIIGVLLILQVWDVAIGALLASLGIAGAILGLAFKQTLENIFGGIGLIMDNSFKKGDFIQLDDGEVGEVMEINLRSTKLKNYDSETVIMPNSILANKKIINLAQPTPTMRVTIPLSVAYGSDIDQVKQILHDSMRGHKDILAMPRRIARFIKFGDSGLEFNVYFHISNYRDHYEIRDAVMTQIYKDLYDNGIEIPFPIRTLVTAKKNQYAKKWKNKSAKVTKTP